MLKPTAVKITRKNHPIAVACLAAGFGNIPIENTLGCYLVINKMHVEHFKGEGRRPYLVLGNTWLTKKNFNRLYRFVDKKHDKNEFAEVTRY